MSKEGTSDPVGNIDTLGFYRWFLKVFQYHQKYFLSKPGPSMAEIGSPVPNTGSPTLKTGC